MWKGVKKISASAMAAILVAMSVPMAAFADSASDDTSGGGALLEAIDQGSPGSVEPEDLVSDSSAEHKEASDEVARIAAEEPRNAAATTLDPLSQVSAARGTVYEIASGNDVASAVAAIEASDSAEATIKFTANNIDVNGFAGIAGKRVVLCSTEGHKFTLDKMGTELVGDLVLDNVRCWGDYSKVFANGHSLETTINFEAAGNTILRLFGGGSAGNDVAGDTNLVLRGGRYTDVYGGGMDSNVSGSTSVTIDGPFVHAGGLYGGGHAHATDKGRVGGDATVAVRQGTNGMLFGGGQNEYSVDSREPASVAGSVRVTLGYPGAPAGSVNTGIAMYTYGGSWHSTVGNVVLELLDGSTNASTGGDRNYFGCGYRDTVRGTVKVIVDGSDLRSDGHVYGGGNTDSNMTADYGSVCILNENNEPHALEMTYNSASDNTDGGMQAGSSGSIPTEIKGDALLRMAGGNIAFAILDNGDAGACAIAGEATIRVTGGRIAQIQGNKNDVGNSHLVYDGCGSADAPQESGYVYRFKDVALVNAANVRIDSDAFFQFSGIQSPFYSKPDLSIGGASMLTTRDSDTQVSKVSADDSTWHALGKVYVYEDLTSKNGHYFWDKYFAVGQGHKSDPDPALFDAYRGEGDEFVGLKEGTFVSRFYGNVSLSDCDVAFMGPVNVSGNFSGGNSLLRLPVATGSNYTGGDDSPAIPLNVDGIATGSLSVLAVNASDRLIPSAPALGDNYVTGWKADGASDEAFVLANDDEATIAAGLYLKRVEDPGVNDGSYYMWQVAKKPSYRVTYEFVSGTKDKGLPQEVTDLLPIDPASYAHGSTVAAIRPAETEVRTDDGVWAFKGYDADSKVAAGAVGFTGTWVFNPNASVLNRVPAISASDRVIAVGDAFDPLEDVSARDEEDGDLTDKVEVLSSTVDASKPGVYEVVYKVADGDGASAVKTIKVTVQARMQELPGNSDGDSNAGSQTPGNKLVKTGDAWALGASALVGAVVLAGAVLLSARRLMKNESGRIK